MAAMKKNQVRRINPSNQPPLPNQVFSAMPAKQADNLRISPQLCVRCNLVGGHTASKVHPQAHMGRDEARPPDHSIPSENRQPPSHPSVREELVAVKNASDLFHKAPEDKAEAMLLTPPNLPENTNCAEEKLLGGKKPSNMPHKANAGAEDAIQAGLQSCEETLSRPLLHSDGRKLVDCWMASYVPQKENAGVTNATQAGPSIHGKTVQIPICASDGGKLMGDQAASKMACKTNAGATDATPAGPSSHCETVQIPTRPSHGENLVGDQTASNVSCKTNTEVTNAVQIVPVTQKETLRKPLLPSDGGNLVGGQISSDVRHNTNVGVTDPVQAGPSNQEEALERPLLPSDGGKVAGANMASNPSHHTNAKVSGAEQARSFCLKETGQRSVVPIDGGKLEDGRTMCSLPHRVHARKANTIRCESSSRGENHPEPRAFPGGNVHSPHEGRVSTPLHKIQEDGADATTPDPLRGAPQENATATQVGDTSSASHPISSSLLRGGPGPQKSENVVPKTEDVGLNDTLAGNETPIRVQVDKAKVMAFADSRDDYAPQEQYWSIPEAERREVIDLLGDD